MTALIWDEIGQRTYQNSLDHGVLYLSDRSGVPWNGLTSVDEKSTGGSVTPLFFEGVKYNDVVSIGDFSASVKAFTYPDEFLEFEGLQEPEPGFYVTGQMTPLFGLSYRTKISNDVDSDVGYKLHVLCNLTAVPSNKAYKTQSASPVAIEFEWNVSAIPSRISGFRPTSHLIFDSTKIDSGLLQEIEDILYGTTTTDAMLPEFSDLVDFATSA